MASSPSSSAESVDGPTPERRFGGAVTVDATGRTRVGVRIVLLLGALTALGPLTIDLYLPALPTMARELDSTPSALQLTLTACLVGLAVGQAVVGPLSDQVGRKRPMVIGLGAYALASVACALAPTVEVLICARVVQALSAASGLVVARAVVRDLVSGREIARLLSALMLVTGAAPILAPMLGGQLLELTGWRGLFAALAVFGVVQGLAVFRLLPESLPPEQRRRSGVVGSLRTYGMLLGDRIYMGYALTGAIGFGSMFAYISGSPFVLQEVYQVSPQVYGLLFGLNGVFLVIGSQSNGFLVRRFDPRRMMAIGQGIGLVGTLCLVGAALLPIGTGGLAAIMASLVLAVGSRGLVMPNATALSLGGHPEAAGSASALMGTLQFAIGAVTGPLVTIVAVHNAVPMALVMLLALLVSIAATYVLAVPGERALARRSAVEE